MDANDKHEAWHNSHSNSKSNKPFIHGHVLPENIQVATSITNAIIEDDGCMTPTPNTVITTSIFEDGVHTATVQNDASVLSRHHINIKNPLFELSNLSDGSGNTSKSASRSTSPNPSSLNQPNQNETKEQRQRELHYENANAVLVPPLNFAMVSPGIYRSGHPNKHNFPFLRKLGLKVIVQMSEEPYSPELVEFLKGENIQRILYKIEGNKVRYDNVAHRIGCLIGCLRRIQNWSMTSIFDEYRRFAGSKVLADQEFIEIFSAKVPYSLEHKPSWLD
ncbi:hypothetical protein BGZ76_011281 [Entomortierella beljakovae]|nr:hypothetical protein BGZ76_011281 [Entomortierella beljakovae]